MSAVHVAEQRPPRPPSLKGFNTLIEGLLREGDKLTDRAVQDLLQQFSNLRRDLRRRIVNDESFKRRLNDIVRELDEISAMHAGAIGRIGLTAYDQAWDQGQRSALETIQYGQAVQAGVGPAGAAYYAPELFAPHPGFLIGAMAEHEAAMRAFTFDRITMVTEEMRTAIRSAVTVGYIGADTPYHVMQQITHIVGIRDMPYFRELGTTGVSAKAENIWRTEITAAQNMSNHLWGQQAAERLPDLKHAWMATGDDRTRDTHIDAHGQIQPYDQPFIVGGFAGMYPGDPALPLRERARCRCREIAYREDWGELSEIVGEDLTSAIEAEKERRAAGEAAVRPTGFSGTPVGENRDQIRWGMERWETKPFVSEMYGEIAPTQPWGASSWNESARCAFKEDLCMELSRRTGFDPELISEAIRTWADTSNDANLRSLSLQRTAERIWNESALSEWQRMKLNGLEEELRAANWFAKKADPGWSTPAFERIEITRAGDAGRYLADQSLSELGLTGEQAREKFLQAMADYSQHQLREAGLDRVILYRGVTTVPEGLPAVGETVDIAINAMSSWSSSYEAARLFTGGTGYIVEIEIPITRVVGTFRTGFGCANEWEYVITGGNVADRATVVWKSFRAFP